MGGARCADLQHHQLGDQLAAAEQGRRADPLNPACPCGTGRPYAGCCGRYHAGPLQGLAPDAEALMRSRYSAFALRLTDYLLMSWHPLTRPPSLTLDDPGPKWLGLEIRRVTSQDADHAIVEFVARSRLGGRATRMHETSRFVRVDGRWLYLEGELH